MQMEQTAADRVQQLEKLVSSLRHDLRGLITPASLVADRLQHNDDPAIQRSANMIAGVIERVVARLNATYELVPPRGSAGPLIGAGGKRL